MSTATAARFRRVRPALVALGLCALAGIGGAGCVQSTWPPIEEGKSQSNPSQINSAPTPKVIGEALSFVTLRYPPVGLAERGRLYDVPFAFCLPPGADADAYDLIARRVQRGAQPATDANTDLPTYYVSRVIVRGVTAEVDVLRPVPELGADAQGRARYQGVTVYLLGSLSTWKADRHHTFPVGLFEVPERTTRPPTYPTWGLESGPSEK
ncbi:MAG: hypothetical protein K2Q09_09335 [Phycisphaerales bacterium]|nr:hypothetical protein [Phycisphaerales bacterium]